MTMEEFYNKYKTNRSYFAPIAGVGVRSLTKFENGETIRESTKTRIEKAMRVAEKYNLVRPEYNHAEALGMFGHWYNTKFQSAVREYEAQFKKLIEEEI